MRCPACGYNSFEYRDICMKCGKDLAGHKQSFGLAPLVLPADERQAVAAALALTMPVDERAQEAAEGSSEVFSFDLPAADQAPAGGDAFSFDLGDEGAGVDPFRFDEEPAAATSPAPGPFSFDDAAGSDLFGTDAAADVAGEQPAVDLSLFDTPDGEGTEDLFGELSLDDLLKPGAEPESPEAPEAAGLPQPAGGDAFADLLEQHPAGGPAAEPPPLPAAEEDIFGGSGFDGLLEQPSRGGPAAEPPPLAGADDLFGGDAFDALLEKTAEAAPATGPATVSEAADAGPLSLDLDNFSWGDSPAGGGAPEEGSRNADDRKDDLDSLFDDAAPKK